jgi:hypothetical protein
MAFNFNQVTDGQDYQLGYLSLGGNDYSTAIESFDLDLVDGGEDVKTLVLGYAGRCGGAAMATLNFSGAVPYNPTTGGGVGTHNTGMEITTSTGQRVSIAETMLSPLNSVSNVPTTFSIFIGKGAVETLTFKGQVSNLKFSSAIGKVFSFSGTATGTFSIFKP